MKVIFIFLLLSVGVLGHAQNCYDDTRKKGMLLLNQGHYTEAIEQFEAAKDCPDKPSPNDLETKIQECRRKKQEEDRIELERRKNLENEERREREERQRRERENEVASNGYMNIVDLEFANEGSTRIENDYGSTLYASDVKYLRARMIYNGLCNSQKKISLSCRLYDPSGNLLKGDPSDSYSFTDNNITVNSGNGNKEIIAGYGSKTGGSYKPGIYKYEIWYKGKKLYEKSFELYKKSGEASYLKVNDKYVVSSDFTESGGTKTFYISTDAGSWTTWGVPSWCSIVEKSDKSFKLKCKQNHTASSRNDYLKVKAGDKEVCINITQDGATLGASIEKIWVDHNQFQGFLNGMIIHIKFSTEGLKSHPCECSAFFYFQNGNKLLDYDGFYKSGDGQVAVGEVFEPTYESSEYKDFKLFMPYDQLHMRFTYGQTVYRLKFHIQLYDKSIGKTLCSSDYVDFTYTH